MTKIEALKLELAARELVEGTGLEWWEVVRIIDLIKGYKIVLGHAYKFAAELKDYELAVRVIECKPVWKNESELWWKDDGDKLDWSQYCPSWNWDNLSWNPPKPKTVMVELPVEDVKIFSAYKNIWESPNLKSFAEACRKALENLK